MILENFIKQIMDKKIRMGGRSRFISTPDTQTDFFGLPEEKSVHSSSPVLKKPKLEANEKSKDTNDHVQIGFEKISSSASDDLPVSTYNY